MSTQLINEDATTIFLASQAAWNILEEIKNRRLFQLEVLYLTLKDKDPVDSILQSIDILDVQEANQRKKYESLVASHRAALETTNQQINQGEKQ